MKCAKCPDNKCHGAGGRNCTKLTHDEVKAIYRADPENVKIMETAAAIEGRHYCQFSRLEESAEFIKLMGLKKVGLAFCVGLREEAGYVSDYLSKFAEVESVCCKVCSMPKAELGLEQIKPGVEAMCNPMVQAKLLNDAGCEVNFTVGLCVGHDMLFNKATKVPTSCIITKDRLLGHNPAAAVNNRYWRNKLGILR